MAQEITSIKEKKKKTTKILHLTGITHKKMYHYRVTREISMLIYAWLYLLID